MCLRVKGTPTPGQTSKTQPLSSCYRQIYPMCFLAQHSCTVTYLGQNNKYDWNDETKTSVTRQTSNSNAGFTGAVHCRLGLLQHASEHKLKQNLSQLPSSLFTGILNRCMICFWLTYPTYRTGIDHSFYFIFQISIDHSEWYLCQAPFVEHIHAIYHANSLLMPQKTTYTRFF